jgi:hypothetical protein
MPFPSLARDAVADVDENIDHTYIAVILDSDLHLNSELFSEVKA